MAEASVANLHTFIEKLRPLTNTISFIILKDHAAGHGTHTLHAFVNSILRAQSPDAICATASALIQLGHSTGWDVLTGVLTGMLLTFRHEGCRNH
jgi:hypothetical protein